MKPVDAKQGQRARRVGWLLGPVVVARSSDASDDEELAQAYDLAIAAVVDVKSCPIGNTNSEHIREVAAASGVGLVVLPGSLFLDLFLDSHLAKVFNSGLSERRGESARALQ